MSNEEIYDSSESHEEIDDEDDSDDDDNVESELRGTINILIEQLEENDKLYDVYVQLISCFRRLGELEDARKMREKMSQVFPLSPKLWLDWIQDEETVCTNLEEKEYVISLFCRAVKDYISVKLWVEYIIFMLGFGDHKRTQLVCDEALMNAGSHVGEGNLVWHAVELVEQQVYTSLKDKVGEGGSESKELQNQLERIQSLYRRKARIPLLNLDQKDFLQEARTWFNGTVDPQLKKDLEESLIKLESLSPFEDALLQADDDNKKLAAYMVYIAHAKKNCKPPAVQNLFERAVAELPLYSNLWEEYVDYSLTQFPTLDCVILPLCERSQRNCPWSHVLCDFHMAALQKFEDSLGEEAMKKQVNACLEKALQSGSQSGEDIAKMWMSYLVYLRRKIVWDKPHQDEIEAFNTNCRKAVQFIDQYFGESGDALSVIPRFQAKILAVFEKDMKSVHEIWNDVVLMRNNNFKNPHMWLEYITLERHYGTAKHCRKLFRRALERVWDNIDILASAFMEFEHETGDVHTMEDFRRRYSERMIHVKKRNEDLKAKEVAEKEDKRGKQKGKMKRKLPSEEAQAQGEKTPDKEFKTPSKKGRWNQPAKQKQGHISEKSPSNQSSKKVVFDKTEPNRNGETEEKMDISYPAEGFVKPSSGFQDVKTFHGSKCVDPPSSFKDIEPPPGFKGAEPLPGSKDTEPPPGFKDVEPPPGFKDVEPPPGFKDVEPPPPPPGYSYHTEHELKKSQTNHGETVAHDASINMQTVFLSNLDYSVQEEDILSQLRDCGEVEDLRMVKDFKGRFKGYAYLVFKSASAVDKALVKDRTRVKGRPMFISHCNPNKSGHAFKYSSGKEKQKLFVRNLPLSANEDDIRLAFEEHGPIKEIRLVTYRNGFSKGICYITYHDAETAEKARQAMDGQTMMDKKLVVLISDPSLKKKLEPSQGEEIFKSPQPPPVFGSQRSAQKPKLAFIPRNLRVPGKSSGETTGAESAPKSNEDFRKMLVKKS